MSHIYSVDFFIPKQSPFFPGTLRPLTDYQDGLDAKQLPFCGEKVDPDLALNLALGNVDLVTLKTKSNFDPDNPVRVEKPRYGRRFAFSSIWRKDILVDEPPIADSTSPIFSTKPRPSFTSSQNNSQKRKRDNSPPSALVCTPEYVNEVIDAKDNCDEKDIIDTYAATKKIVVKSRFFKTNKPDPKPKVVGDWLEQVEQGKKDDNDINYHPDLIKDDQEKENGSNQVLKQPFKPVRPATLNSEDMAKKRNPFAKTKTPEKKARLDIPESPTEVSYKDLKCSPLISNTPHLALNVTETAQEESPKKETSEVSTSSPYFTPKQPLPNQGGKGPSGLFKSKSNRPSNKKHLTNDKKQKSLLDMWKKS